MAMFHTLGKSTAISEPSHQWDTLTSSYIRIGLARARGRFICTPGVHAPAHKPWVPSSVSLQPVAALSGSRSQHAALAHGEAMKRPNKLLLQSKQQGHTQDMLKKRLYAKKVMANLIRVYLQQHILAKAPSTLCPLRAPVRIAIAVVATKTVKAMKPFGCKVSGGSGPNMGQGWCIWQSPGASQSVVEKSVRCTNAPVWKGNRSSASTTSRRAKMTLTLQIPILVHRRARGKRLRWENTFCKLQFLSPSGCWFSFCFLQPPPPPIESNHRTTKPPTPHHSKTHATSTTGCRAATGMQNTPVMWCDVMWCDVMWCDCAIWLIVRPCDVMWCGCVM